jgi:hypothetical protein
MITDKDLDFHLADPVFHNWAETNYFAFFNAEHAICGHLQALFRPNIGVVMSDVRVWRGLVDHSADTWYISNHFHMPIAPGLSLRDYTLPNGLSVKAMSPRNYRVDYVGIEDSRIHLDVNGIMEPYDIADPEMDPITRSLTKASWTFASAYNGHFDMSAHVTGEVTVRGETIPIDCVQVMDHSWGPRTEVDLAAMMWLGADFGDNFAIHAFFPADPANSDILSPLAHGYVTERGVVRGLIKGQLQVSRLGYQPVAIVFEAEDATGRHYRLYGAAIAGGPWPVYPSVDVGLALMRWTLGDKVGHGMAMENSSMAYRTRHGRACRPPSGGQSTLMSGMPQ